MQDYSKLVEDLRNGVGYWYMNNSSRLVSILGDAADAIEALQAEIRESMQRCAECGDELAHQMPKREEVWKDVIGYMEQEGRNMSECVVRMEMPRVCITENGYYGYCPMDRVWCIQRNAPPDITMREAYEAMTEKIPSWCPIICQLPEGHGRLVDADALNRKRKHLIKTENGVFPKSEWFIKANDLFAAKTIVPAERSET